MEDENMKQRIWSILVVFLLVFSVVPLGVLAQETEATEDGEETTETAEETEDEAAEEDDEETAEAEVDEETAETAEVATSEDSAATSGDTTATTIEASEEATEETEATSDLTEEDVEELGLEDVSEAQEALQETGKEAAYARAYFFLTEKILTAEAVIAFLLENFPNIDISAIEAYKTQLESIRDGLTQDADFEAVHEQVVALVAEARADTAEILEANNVELSDVKEAVKGYKDESVKDDEAKEEWGLARSAYAKAKATVVLARLSNLKKFAERYGDAEGTAELEGIISELQTIADEIAAAVQDFDKDKVDALVKQSKELVDKAKEIIKDMKGEVKEKRKAEREAIKEKLKELKAESEVVEGAIKEKAKDVREIAKAKYKAKYGSARGLSTEDAEDTAETSSEEEATTETAEAEDATTVTGQEATEQQE